MRRGRGASAGRITVVMPHYSYARSDKKDAPRISLGGRLAADLLVAAGASRVLAMTLHSPQVHGFFSVPVDHLHALRELAAHFRQYDLSRTTVVSPDLGNAKEAAAFARMLGAQVAAGAKQRYADDRVSISAVIGDVAGRDVIVLDDEIAKGSTVLELLDRLREAGPRTIRIACTHGLFAAGALGRLSEQPDVLEIVCTNTVPVPADDHTEKLRILSIAPALAEAVRRIHNGESVSCPVRRSAVRLTPSTSSRVGRGGISPARPVIRSMRRGQRVGTHQVHPPAPVEHLAAGPVQQPQSGAVEELDPAQVEHDQGVGALRLAVQTRGDLLRRRDVDLAPELQHRVPPVAAHVQMPGGRRGLLPHDDLASSLFRGARLPTFHCLLRSKSYPDRASLSMFD